MDNSSSKKRNNCYVAKWHWQNSIIMPALCSMPTYSIMLEINVPTPVQSLPVLILHLQLMILCGVLDSSKINNNIMTTERVFINNLKKSSYGLENFADQLNDSILPESSGTVYCYWRLYMHG